MIQQPTLTTQRSSPAASDLYMRQPTHTHTHTRTHTHTHTHIRTRTQTHTRTHHTHTHLRAHETGRKDVCSLLREKKKKEEAVRTHTDKKDTLNKQNTE